MILLGLVNQVIEEKKDEGKDNFSLILVKDLIKLHEDCDFCLSHSDDKTLNYLQELIESQKNVNEIEFYKQRVELYYHYARKLNKDLIEYADELSDGLVNIDSTYTLINSCNRKLDKIEISTRLNTTETLKELSAILNSLIEEYNRLTDEESELRKKGFDKFVVSLIPVLTIASGIFGAILFKTDFVLKSMSQIVGVIIIYIIYIFVVSWGFRYYQKK